MNDSSTWMHRHQNKLFWVIVFGAFAGLFAVAAFDSTTESDNDRLQRLRESYACPTCDGQSVAESQASVAEVISAVIEEEIRTGATDVEIRDLLIKQYTAEVLLNPSSEGIWAFIWIAPLVVLAGGSVAVLLALNRQRVSLSNSKVLLVLGFTALLVLGIAYGMTQFVGERGVNDLITGDTE